MKKFKKRKPILLISLITLFVLIVSMCLLLLNQKTHMYKGLILENNRLQTQNQDLQNNIDKLQRNHPCSPSQHNCILIRESDKVVVGRYRKRGAGYYHTFRLFLPQGWSLGMWSERNYLLNFRNDDENVSVWINSEDDQHKSETCIFPESFPQKGVAEILKRYNKVQTATGVLRLGMTQEQLDKERIDSLWLCQESQEGNSNWITETDFGITKIDIPEGDAGEIDVSLIPQLIQIFRSIRITDTTLTDFKN